MPARGTSILFGQVGDVALETRPDHPSGALPYLMLLQRESRDEGSTYLYSTLGVADTGVLFDCDTLKAPLSPRSTSSSLQMHFAPRKKSDLVREPCKSGPSRDCG